jgi:RNA polymerase subunit RPABC4/transcription elongation factor Spt4
MTVTTTGTANGRFDIRTEIRVIPGWAFALAVIIFVLCPFVFFGLVWPRETDPPPLPLQIVIPFLPATILAFLALMVGYVNRDAGRRGMSRTLWTLLVIFIPNAIGFILYFLLRNPIRVECPKCGTVIDPRVNFCPRCGHSFHPTCPQCRAAVRPGDAFCPNCGTQLGQVA